jgi:putative intracellular protease/amidase
MQRENQAYILVAPGFEEEFVVRCLCQMRRYGAAVSLVGVSSQLLTGKAGLTVRPDCSLAQLIQPRQPDDIRLLVIPGEQACATQLLSDPRVHLLVKNIFLANGFVAATLPTVQHTLTSVGLLTAATLSQFLLQGQQETAVFIRSLLGDFHKGR